MASLVLTGDTSGQVTLAAPAVAGTTTLTLPATTGTVIATDASANIQFNSGYGSVATAYGCRAWVNFNGTGTVAIRASGNVSSITDNGTGDYNINFTTAMTDANFAVAGIAGQFGVSNAFVSWTGGSTATLSASAAKIQTLNNTGAGADVSNVAISIFR